MGSSPEDQTGSQQDPGACDEPRADVERLQRLERQYTGELDQARRRIRDEIERASRARERAMKALEARASLRAARASQQGATATEPMSWAQLSFATDGGRVAFDRFRRGELAAAELEQQLRSLGENQVIGQIRNEGMRARRADSSIPWPEEQRAVRDAIAAREELRAHERESENAQRIASQVALRLAQVSEELADARRRLDDCQRGGSAAFDDF